MAEAELGGIVLASITPAYRLLEDGEAIQCLACGLVSHNPNDVVQRYCGRCHKFHHQ